MPTTAIPVTQMTRWLHVQSVAGLCALVGIAGWPQHVPLVAPWLAAGIALAFAWLWTLLGLRLTAANAATAGRLVGLCALLAVSHGVANQAWWWFFGAILVVVADLLDGALARRFGGSEPGAILDMETDQFTVFGLAFAVVAAGGARWVLVLPALRWSFVLAMALARRPAHDPKPKNGDNRRGRRICAAVMVALLLALCPLVPRAAGDAATGVAVALLCWSFLDDARWLLARRNG